MKNRFAWAAVLALAALLAVVPLFAAEEGTFDRTLKVTGAVDLDVSTGSGSISVHSGGAGQVVIHAIVRASDNWGLFQGGSAAERVKAVVDHPPIEQSGNVIRIGHFADSSIGRNVSISYDITTPADTKLRSHSGSGSQTLNGLAGPIEAGTGSGSMHVADVTSDARLSTGSGSIDVSNIGGSVRASAGSGSIAGDRLGGGASVQTSAKYQGKALALASGGTSSGGRYLEFETGSGHIRLTGITGELRAHTGSGGIEAEGRQTGDWELHTGSGAVRVRLPADAKFSLSARTSSGSISSDFPVTMQGAINRRELHGDVNGGGPHLDIHTASGGIHIEK